MRLPVLLLLLATPAAGWEFRASQICELTHSEASADVRVSYDPRAALYAITVTTPAPWPTAQTFGLRFDGPRGGMISTQRHDLSRDGRALSVTDTGFGNVLYGLEHNETATALSGNAAATVSLDGAAPAVRAFRACIAAPSV